MICQSIPVRRFKREGNLLLMALTGNEKYYETRVREVRRQQSRWPAPIAGPGRAASGLALRGVNNLLCREMLSKCALCAGVTCQVWREMPFRLGAPCLLLPA